MPTAKFAEAALRERTDKLEQELAVERAARLVQERRAARCLELLRALERERDVGGRTPETEAVVDRLKQALSGMR